MIKDKGYLKIELDYYKQLKKLDENAINNSKVLKWDTFSPAVIITVTWLIVLSIMYMCDAMTLRFDFVMFLASFSCFLFLSCAGSKFVIYKPFVSSCKKSLANSNRNISEIQKTIKELDKEYKRKTIKELDKEYKRKMFNPYRTPAEKTVIRKVHLTQAEIKHAIIRFIMEENMINGWNYSDDFQFTFKNGLSVLDKQLSIDVELNEEIPIVED